MTREEYVKLLQEDPRGRELWLEGNDGDHRRSGLNDPLDVPRNDWKVWRYYYKKKTVSYTIDDIKVGMVLKSKDGAVDVMITKVNRVLGILYGWNGTYDVEFLCENYTNADGSPLEKENQSYE